MEQVALALGLFEGATGIFGSRAQSRVDKAKIQLGFEDNLEKIRRRKFEQDQTLGQSKLLTEAAGVTLTPGSTAQQFMDSMAQEFKYELDWMREYASRARKLGVKSANVRASTNLLRSVTGGLKTYASLSGGSE